MKRTAIFILFSSLIGFSCGIPNARIFSKKSDHEKYADKVEDRLSKTPEGREWLAASELSIRQP